MTGPVYSLQSCTMPEAVAQEALLQQAVSALRSIAAWDANHPEAAKKMKARAEKVLQQYGIPPHAKRGNRQG